MSNWSKNYNIYKNSSISDNPLPNGTYYIVSIYNSSYAIDNTGNIKNSSNVYVWSHSVNVNQQWYIQYESGYYRILVNSNRSIGFDIEGDGRAWNNRTNIQLYSAGANKANQQFRIMSAIDGGYYIGTYDGKLVEVCLDNANVVSNGTNVYIYEPTGVSNQRWNFVSL